ncbi:MAG TPA: P1 family peptidase [Candidatus Dormibacteraeota bacterium]|nr:P1 family peptidase [Candidatus Dormibacteraeota bacterium]
MVRTICEVPGVRVGNVTDAAAHTGCTCIVFDGGATAGVDVRGGAPGTRDTDVLDPVNTVERVHALLLTGGSTFGLEAATGAVRCLEESGIGLDVGVARVPIVPAAVLFDLAVAARRPDAAMGYAAARGAARAPFACGNVGAGAGATVGKVLGAERAMKGGLGTAAISRPWGEATLVVGALAAVNAVGHVRDPESGEILAGPRGDDGVVLDAAELLRNVSPGGFDPRIGSGRNTTLAVVATNAALTKTQATRVAQVAHDAFARTIQPVHTSQDGDTIFAASTGDLDVPLDVVCALACAALERAILAAVREAEGIPGYPAYRDLTR